MLSIDGSYGEAGGQILRTALGLAVLTQTPIRVFNIRAKRAQPGLRAQHLEGLRAVGQLCDAKIAGDRLGSTEIEFIPGPITKTELTINIPTAGSIGLVLQTLQIACVYGRHINIVINGGADFGKFCPPIPWLQAVLLPLLQRMGYVIEIESLKSGFYPKGGAQTEIKIIPAKKLKPINLTEQGKIKSLRGLSIAAHQLELRRVAERQAKSAEKIIEKELGLKTEIKTKYVEALNPGSGIVLWLETDKGAILGSSGIGQLGITSEQIGQSAAKELIEDWQSGACLDRHAADQILPFLALAEGKSVVAIPELTSHAQTNIWVIEQFLKSRFSISGKRPVLITCSGSGL